MIVATCLNPALDITYSVPQLRPGESHRVERVAMRAGGKGTNAARVLQLLGADVTLLAPVGGVNGQEFDTELAGTGLRHEFVPIGGRTRRTVTVVAGAAGATVFNEPGPTLTDSEWAGIVDRFGALLQAGDVAAVLSGSLPGVAETAYADLVALAAERRCPVILDTDGSPLARALEARPDIVKINAVEASNLFGQAFSDPFEASSELIRRGAHAAIVTLGADGLAAVVDGRKLRARLDRPIVADNPTGAGDALAARLAYGLTDGQPWPTLLAAAVAVSAAAATAPWAGDYDLDLAGRLQPHVIVEEY